jgi:hypothetical protein
MPWLPANIHFCIKSLYAARMFKLQCSQGGRCTSTQGGLLSHKEMCNKWLSPMDTRLLQAPDEVYKGDQAIGGSPTGFDPTEIQPLSDDPLYHGLDGPGPPWLHASASALSSGRPMNFIRSTSAAVSGPASRPNTRGGSKTWARMSARKPSTTPRGRSRRIARSQTTGTNWGSRNRA